MSTQEIYNELLPLVGLNSQTIANDITTVGNIIDTQNADKGILYLILSGVLADGVYDISFRESDDSAMSGENVVDDISLVSASAGFNFTAVDDNVIKAVGLIGTKRYVRMSISSNFVGSGGIFSASVVAKGNTTSVYGL
jgi:hypothetical protein